MLVCVCVHARTHVCVCTDTYSDSDGKESACSTGDPGSIPGSRRCPGEGNGNPLQYSCLGNLTDRGAWLAGYTVHRAAKSWTRLS